MLSAAAEAVLRGNWRTGWRRDSTPFAFTCPCAGRYKHQRYWDSCFHAIVWSRFDPTRARGELRTLLRAGRADGFVPTRRSGARTHAGGAPRRTRPPARGATRPRRASRRRCWRSPGSA